MSSPGSLPPAVVLAAGESSRFWPLSTHGHKALHRLGGKAIIEHTVDSLASAGITELVVVQSPIARDQRFPHRTIAGQLGSGDRYGLRITYVDQEKADGQGPALKLATKQLGDDYFVIQPENINAGAIVSELWAARHGVSAVVAGQERDETWMFGVFTLQGDLIRDVVEKPAPGTEPSKICNMGVQLLSAEFTAELQRQPDHEISNILALQALAKHESVRVVATPQPFFPLKYPWHLFAMARHLHGERPFVGKGARIADTAVIGDGCVIEPDVEVTADVTLTDCLVGAGSRVSTSMNDSILGAAVTIEPDVDFQSRPLDHGHVQVDVKGNDINTGLRRLGSIIGQGARIASGVTLTAGTLIGAESEIPPGVRITTNVPDRTAADVFEASRRK